MSKFTTEDDIKFLLSFAPATSPEHVVDGLMSSFYITGTYSGDVKLAQRMQEIIKRHNIDISSITDEFTEE